MVLSGEKWLKNVVTDTQILEKNMANNLSWTLPVDASGVVILRHSSPITDEPSDGTTYVVNNTVGSATVVYVGTNTSFVDSGLTNDTTYYYSIHSYDSNNQYSNAVKIFGEPKRSENKQRIGMGQWGGCLIDNENEPYCWGYGGYGLIGNGSLSNQSSPTAVTLSGITNSKEFTHISVGANTYACGVTKDEELWCWGHNSSGQLGQGDVTQVTTPVQIPGDWRSVSAETVNEAWNAAHEHNCAIDTSGDLYCTGESVYGAIGDGTTAARRTVMTKVIGGLKWKSVSPGANHTCGVTMEGEGLCWGYSGYHTLGNGSTSSRYAPFSIAEDRQWKDLSAGQYSSCGITHDNESYCWGDNTTYGQLGDGTTTDRPLPTQITGHEFRKITSGEVNRCAVTTDDDLYCWGSNQYSSLGDNNTGVHQSSPTFIMGDVNDVTTGRLSSCAVKNDGQLYCWGGSAYNEELGVGWDVPSLQVPWVLNYYPLDKAIDDYQILPYSARLEHSWSVPSGITGVIVLRSSAEITEELVDSTTYTTGDTLGSSTVVYAGNATSFSETGLTNDTIYHYKISTYSGSAGSEKYYTPITRIAIPKIHSHKRIGTGLTNNCEINSDNQLYCWGQEYGNGTASSSSIPFKNRHRLRLCSYPGRYYICLCY